jgi:hypothetical protein
MPHFKKQPKGWMRPRRQCLQFQKALVRTAGLVIFFNVFGTCLHLAFKLHGGHKEVEEGDQVAIDGGEAGLEGIPLKAVVTDILPDNGAVFLFDSDQRSANSYRFSCGLGSG